MLTTPFNTSTHQLSLLLHRLHKPKQTNMFACDTIISVVDSLAMLAAPVSARPWAGGVDMDAACVSQWAVSFHAQNDKADNAANSTYDWYCTDGNNQRNLDVGAFCAGGYGGNAYADPQGKKKYDWGCYYP